jgi:transposase
MKLKAKIKEHGLYTRKGKTWLEGLGMGSICCYLRVMATLCEEIRRLSLELRHIAAGDEDVRLLMTVPGVCYCIALLVKAEVGDIGRFRSGDHLAGYAGIVPSTHSSGKVTRHGRITREGSAWLRWAMVEAALVHLRYDTPVTRFYHRVAERRGAKTARVAAARKLLTVCWSVLRSRRPYFNPVGAQV